MVAPMKLKRCSVKLAKLNRLSFLGVTPSEIQEQMLDQRVKKCFVRLPRCKDYKNQIFLVVESSAGIKKYKMRRCCIKLQRLNVGRSEISTTPPSVVSTNLLSDNE